jgi:hypothetical protein
VPKITSIHLAIKAIRELGPWQSGLYAWYRFTLRSGYLRRKTGGVERAASQNPTGSTGLDLAWLKLPSREILLDVIGPQGLQAVLDEADEIVEGQVRLFGGPPVALQIAPPGPLEHWTVYEHQSGLIHDGDIKWIWEPGRFGWACTLARAYHLSGDEKYSRAFWGYTQEFLVANPPYLGPHWVSAQEAALRLAALTFAARIFSPSEHTTRERLAQLEAAIADHATRIPPTLAYARAQNNNHLLVETAGLLTASLSLPAHPQAQRWLQTGCYWFNRGFQDQIDPQGVYVQHSANYHRLVLQIALWVNLLGDRLLLQETKSLLAAATRWLLELTTPEDGQVPNLGPNDSAYILPLSTCSWNDYRPVLQAASRAFLEEPAFPAGSWDEMSLWFGLDPSPEDHGSDPPELSASNSRHVRVDEPLIVRAGESWAYLRAAQFTSRPGHADQLHLDLWWRGLNITQDPGTYLYNAEAPWDNSLARTLVHNTVTLNDQDQMTRAGNFLWLDWAQAQVLEQTHNLESVQDRVVVQHDGYRQLNALHRRSVDAQPDRWAVTDAILPARISRLPFSTPNSPLRVRLQWLLPDWPWEIKERKQAGKIEIRIDSPHGWLSLQVQEMSTPAQDSNYRAQVYRAGKIIYGEGPDSPIRGWVSRNYGYKTPALSFSFEITGALPLTILSEWVFPL